jgi:hypothetical protein
MMRRNSLLVLMSMIVLLIVIGVLLLHIFLQAHVSNTVAKDTAVPATPPLPPEQQMTPLSEPVGIPMRLVYIVSILVVFVSAVLILFRMLLGIPGGNEG